MFGVLFNLIKEVDILKLAKDFISDTGVGDPLVGDDKQRRALKVFLDDFSEAAENPGAEKNPGRDMKPNYQRLLPEIQRILVGHIE